MKKAAMKSTRIVVTSGLQNLAPVVSQLKQHGMKVDSVLEAVGLVVGEIETTKLASLKSIPGISVEPEGTTQIAPPDAEVQ
jgi:hypothetical protein